MDNHYLTCRIHLVYMLLIALYIIASATQIAFPPEVHAVQGLSESQVLKLKKGEILVNVRQAGNEPKGMVEAIILIDAPAENIWQIMLNCPEAPTFVPGLKACRVLESGQNWEIIRHEAKWIWFLPRITYVFRASYELNRKIDFVRIKGDLREMQGSWRLTTVAQGSQTIVSYSVYLDPGFFVPQWLVRQILKADLPELLTSIRTKVLQCQPGP